MLNVTLDDRNESTVTVNDFRLYNLINAEDYGTYNLSIAAEKGVKVYTFTFG